MSTLTHVKVRLNESDMWSPVSHVNTVRRGGADVPGTAPEDGAAVSTPVIVTPVMLLSEDRRKVQWSALLVGARVAQIFSFS